MVYGRIKTNGKLPEMEKPEEEKLVLDPDMDFGKKGRDVIKPTAKLKYEPFSRQTELRN